MKNLIYRAAMEYTADRAAEMLAKALDVECGPQLADSRNWKLANHSARCLMIGEWLRNLAYEAGNEGQRLVSWEPLGGDKYLHKND